ncbi:MAG: hypothetical protein WAN05_23490 [Roseiarcus sp.]
MQFVVRTVDPAGDRPFSHVFPVKPRLVSGLLRRSKSPAIGDYSSVSFMLSTARKLITPATAM